MLPLLRIAALAVWFFGSCAVLTLLALVPRYRYEVVHLFARHVCSFALRILGIELVVRNGARLLARPYVLIPNHQSLLDAFVVGILLQPRTIAVGKKSLRWVPFFGWLFRVTGNLFIDRAVNAKAVATMREAHRRIAAEGLCVVIAPEGTRSGKRGLLPFKKGAFHLAVGTGLPLQPVAISSFHRALDLRRWHAGRILVDVLEPLPTAGLTRDDVPALVVTARERIHSALIALDAEVAGSP